MFAQVGFSWKDLWIVLLEVPAGTKGSNPSQCFEGRTILRLGGRVEPAEVGGDALVVVSELDFVCILQVEGPKGKGRWSVEVV
jgi:hypothetical protein